MTTTKPPLHHIPVGGPFQRVAVDVLQLPPTVNGNRYVVVFMDYLTKWPEAYATSDQTAETIARLFVEQIVCRHGIPQELLSDRGQNFLSTLMQEVCRLLQVKKLNTSGYHPQTDGLVEKFNSTLIEMIAKCLNTSKPSGKLARWALTIQEMDLLARFMVRRLLCIFNLQFHLYVWRVYYAWSVW